jgi:long-chain acyl-CoA synthetase
VDLASIVDGHPDERPALVTDGATVTYGELRARIDAFRGALARAGVEHGDRVALLCGNDASFAVAFLAIVGLGAVAVPLNPTSPGPELARQLAEVEAGTIVVGPLGTDAWRAVSPLAAPSATVIATAGADVDAAVNVGEAAEGDAVEARALDDDTVAALMFTSGTAGASLAAMLSHGNLLANLRQIRSAGDGRLVEDDVIFSVLPLHHVLGLAILLLTLQVGATVVLERRFDPLAALSTIEREGVTVIPGAPPIWVAWSQLSDDALAPLRGIRMGTTGAAKMPEQVAHDLEARCGLVLREGYGLTEASPVVTTSSGIEPRIGSVGQVVPDLELRLVDPDGSDALAGDPGEIWVRGPNVFQGYWRHPEATARVVTSDGWLRTGDVAIADDDGYLWLVDRVKDVIIVSGFNVFPAEVEEVIGQVPGVADVAVVGVAHQQTGEAVRAYVVPEPAAHLDEDAVVSHCREQLARYKCPTKVLFVDELPRNVSGKVLRRVLR